MKGNLCFTIKQKDKEFSLCYSSRDLKFLGGELLSEGTGFIIALGIYDNFSTSTGQNIDAWTTKSSSILLELSEILLQKILKDFELLKYDYRYGLTSEDKSRSSGGRTLKINGEFGVIDARRPGQITFVVQNKEVYDLRSVKPIQTDNAGVLKVYKKRNQINWHEKLQDLINFLKRLVEDEIRIRHYFKKK